MPRLRHFETRSRIRSRPLSHTQPPRCRAGSNGTVFYRSGLLVTQPLSMTQPNAYDGYRKALRYGAACRDAGPFSTGDHELALRWASLARPGGYRVSVALDGDHDGELILVHLPGQQSPAFAIQTLDATVVLIDCLGLTMCFPTLMDALLAMAPIPGPSRGELLHGARPPCIAGLPDILTAPQSCFQRRAADVARAALHRACKLATCRKRQCKSG